MKIYKDNKLEIIKENKKLEKGVYDIEREISSSSRKFNGYKGSSNDLGYRFWERVSMDAGGFAVDHQVIVKRPWKFWTKATAWTYKDDKRIYLNAYKISHLPIISIASTIAHEVGHQMSYADPDNNYGHGKYKIDRKYSFQYWLGRTTKRILENTDERSNR